MMKYCQIYFLDFAQVSKGSQWVYQSGVSQEKANKVSSHVARHTFAVKFLKAKGNTLYALSKAMAHKSMKVTEHYYATYDKTSLDDAMARAFG